MEPRSRLSFTPAFKAEIAELCRRGDRSVGKAARDYDLTETAARMGVSGRAEVHANTQGGQPSDEPELAALERESRRLRGMWSCQRAGLAPSFSIEDTIAEGAASSSAEPTTQPTPEPSSAAPQVRRLLTIQARRSGMTSPSTSPQDRDHRLPGPPTTAVCSTPQAFRQVGLSASGPTFRATGSLRRSPADAAIPRSGPSRS